jgi:dihydroxy-acid dehydratase
MNKIPQHLNKFSRIITEDKTQGASHAMLYALKIKDIKKPHIGIGANWFESNPCNNHLNILSKKIKNSFKEELQPFRFNTIGVSDGITMGTKGMLYSLPSREIIADSYETINVAHSYDGNIAIPGCDKNMPGCLMAMIRINRPSFMIYGGSIKPGYNNNKEIDIVSAFQSYGEYKRGKINDNERENIIKCACPGSGACGGMYTANTMASSIEAMGMSLPNSSSNPALSSDKFNECDNSYNTIKFLLENDIKPLDIINKDSIKNSIVTAIALGGSTNMVLHLLAIAKTANINLKISDFDEIGKNVPVLCNLKPHGDYLMYHLHKIGGTRIIMKRLLNLGLLNGKCLTINGKTIQENLEGIDDNKIFNKNPKLLKKIKNESHIKILKGNIAPLGSVAKITGKEGNKFKGICRVFDSEKEFITTLENGLIKKGTVIVIRFQGPKGGPGMPEMLKPTSMIVGYGLEKDVAFITDGRFSGGSHGFIIGHVSPEAYDGGPIGKLRDGDIITIDRDSINVNLTNKELKKRKIKIPKRERLTGYLRKYRENVSSSDLGCLTIDF